MSSYLNNFPFNAYRLGIASKVILTSNVISNKCAVLWQNKRRLLYASEFIDFYLR